METAYVCNECGEAFIPERDDWPVLRKMHKDECDGATFRKTTADQAF
jgi:hypothetical protein